tara:strand:- start:435 stop:605 length:171 start_codon:yes stop_codon:yes gene_type:complete
MSGLEETHTISPFLAILWVFYPIGVLVLIELFLRSPNDDDDDDFGGGKAVLAYTRS